MKVNKRKNETTAILNRNKIEQAPPGININEWTIYRERYNAAANLFDNGFPIQIDVELNSDCNMRCGFCIQSARDIKKRLLEWETYINVIEQAYSLGARSLKLNYMNEPLIIKDLDRYIKHAIDKGFLNIYISTNALLLTEEYSRRLIKSGLTRIFISLDATTSDIYKQLRNNNHFDKIVENINRFLEIRKELEQQYPIVRVNFLENNVNKHQKEDFILKWEGKSDLIAIQEMNELIDKDTDLHIKKDKSNYSCSFPFKQLVINASGDILPCCTMHGINHKIGNVKDISLKDAWNSKQCVKLRSLHKAKLHFNDPVCKRCISGT